MPRARASAPSKGMTVSIRTVSAIRKRLENPEPLMKQVGILIVADAQKAFREQRLGTFAWKHRYPNQTRDYINIAGAIADLKTSTSVKKRRFDRRPAVRDTSTLLRSITNRGTAIRTTRLAVEVGTTVPYAAQHQWGGVSYSPITDAVRKNYAKLTKRLRGRVKRGKSKDAGSQLAALKRLGGIIFAKKRLVTRITQRPFIGLTDETQSKIVQLFERKLGPRQVTITASE